MMSIPVISKRIWSLCHVLRDDGVVFHKFLSELTYLLFLKIAEEIAREDLLPEGCRWSALTAQPEGVMLGQYRKMLTILGEDAPDYVVREIFRDYRGLFRDAELYDNVAPLVATRGDAVARARRMLEGQEPDHPVGDHCTAPFACEFTDHCHANLDPGPQWPVTVLPAGGGKRWLAAGIIDMGDVDPLHLASPVQARVHRATISGIPWHDREAACATIDQWAYPRTWLDFETIGFALPRWVGTRPYENIPFQFSAHIEEEDGVIRHAEFLSLIGSDPRRACAEALLALLPPQGAVIAYNAPFERGCLRQLAALYPDLAVALTDTADRLVDLLPVTRASWYHRDQRGSWGLKAVLPTVAPQLSYAALVVSDGMQAQLAYLEAIDAALRLYCGRDTEAMIVLADHLTGKARASCSTLR